MFFKITPYWKTRTKYWTSRTDRYRPIYRHHKPRNNQTKNETGIDADRSKDDTNQEKQSNPKQNWNLPISETKNKKQTKKQKDKTGVDGDRSTYNTHTKTIPTIMRLESIQTDLLTTHIPRHYQQLWF